MTNDPSQTQIGVSNSANKTGGFLHKKSNTQQDASDLMGAVGQMSTAGKNSDKKRSTSKLISAHAVSDPNTIIMEEEHTDDDESDKEQGGNPQAGAADGSDAENAAPTSADQTTSPDTSTKKKVPIDVFRHFFEIH